MTPHSLKMVQKIPAGIGDVWELFSNPGNILKLSPEHMVLRIISSGGHPVISPGQIIRYKVKPLWGIPVHWITGIKEVEPGKFFMDVQKKGPYSFWEHRHYFKEIDVGVEMTDSLLYRNPLGMLGNMVNTLFIRNRLRQLFEYRYRQVEEIFGKWKDQQPIIRFS
ncbi:MAG TPA: SRPBCC family protein [Chitinophagaceae bacterium]|jgi:ligand-binding SRPBCC domain-containing protein|nr:SRPBCC family protein [Chitinophagaceae bacterium]